jgi:hypothetical protein
VGAKRAFYLDLGKKFKEDEASKPLMLSISLLKQHTETRTLKITCTQESLWDSKIPREA